MTEHDEDVVVARLQQQDGFTLPPFVTRAILRALKPGDRLPGGLVVVPEKPTWEMEQASLTAPMPPHSNRATKKKRHENLVAKIHSRWNAMLAATTNERGQNADDS